MHITFTLKQLYKVLIGSGLFIYITTKLKPEISNVPIVDVNLDKDGGLSITKSETSIETKE